MGVSLGADGAACNNRLDMFDEIRLAAQAAAHDVEVTLQVTPEVPHVFQAFAAVLDEGKAALRGAGAFLRTHFEEKK